MYDIFYDKMRLNNFHMNYYEGVHVRKIIIQIIAMGVAHLILINS